jgi:hypothetical protein
VGLKEEIKDFTRKQEKSWFVLRLGNIMQQSNRTATFRRPVTFGRISGSKR